MLSTKLGLVFAIIAATIFVSISSVDAVECQSYGQACDKNTTDNPILWLTCQNTNQKQCGCMSGMHWSQEAKSCVAKVGQECYTALEDGRPLKLCTKDAECYPVQNSAGAKEYRCYCGKVMTVPDEDGYCRSIFDGSCNNNLDCLTRAALTCDTASQKCVCDFHGEGQQIWDSSKMLCGSLIGGTCSVSGSNHVNQTCLSPNSRCGSTNICECNAGFTLHDGRCVVDYNSTCTLNSDCAPTFICRNETVETNTTTVSSRLFNSISKIPRDTPSLLSETRADVFKCMCNETLSKYDPSTKSCRTLPDKCNPFGVNTTSNCVPNSELTACTDPEGHAGFSCSCSSGYQAGLFACLGLHSSPCTAPTDCLDTEFLACTANKCECRPGYKYNINTKKCIADLSLPCNGDENCNDQAGATCTESNGRKVCECKTGYSPKDLNGTKICVGGANSTCSASLLCDSDVFLKCQASKCQCNTDHFWDTVSGKPQCWGLSGGVCGDAIGSCPTNSTCTAPNAGNSTLLCSCNEGFKENELKRCVGSGASSIQISGITSILFAIFIAFKN